MNGSAPNSGPTLRATAFAPLIRHFGGSVAGIRDLLQGHKLDPREVRDPYAVVPLAAYLEVFEDAARKVRDPVFGARLGRQLTPADLGPTGLLMIQSATLRRGLERFHSCLAALQSATDVRFLELGGQFEVTYEIRSDVVTPLPQDTEFSLSSICNLIRRCFDPRWSPEEIHFAHGPSRRPDLLQEFFGAPIKFGQATNRILSSSQGLDRHFRSEDTALIALIEHYAADLAMSSVSSSSFKERVRAIVAQNLGQRPINLPMVAAELGFAPRSLQRRLAEEDTSLREIVKIQRREIVTKQLANPDARLKEVAQALGYSDGTVFWRAYRDWTGEAPSRSRIS